MREDTAVVEVMEEDADDTVEPLLYDHPQNHIDVVV